MKIKRLEAHDRLLHLQKEQAINLEQGAEDCLKRNFLSVELQKYSPYIYMFAHPRTADDGVTKRMIWQPRLTKPKAQTNSYLFRAKSNSDVIEICWMIPPKEMWPQYIKGNVTENETVIWSVNQFSHNRQKLEEKDPEDLSDEKCKWIYQTIAREIDEQGRIEKLYDLKKDTKPKTLVESSIVLPKSD